MKLLLALFMFVISVTALKADEFIEIDIQGLTCAFCVDAVQRQLTKLPDIKKAEVSLKLKKVRIYPVSEGIDLDRVRQTITDSGFTPSEVRMVPNEN
ncbi:MAG: hypothetical protein DHS20C01_32120 [marine bacterium B5-7]|nr:MAG: hypothetical protein DHS20C01_32120 [marine bacterium B5-7]